MPDPLFHYHSTASLDSPLYKVRILVPPPFLLPFSFLPVCTWKLLSSELFQSFPLLCSLHRTSTHLHGLSFSLAHLPAGVCLLPVFQEDSFLPSGFLFPISVFPPLPCLLSGYSGRQKAPVPDLPFGIELYGGFRCTELKFFSAIKPTNDFLLSTFGAMFRKSFNLRLFSFSTYMNSFLHLNLS